MAKCYLVSDTSASMMMQLQSYLIPRNQQPYGRVYNKWATATCNTYCSVILDLYDDTSAFHTNNIYRDFFIALNKQTIRSFDKLHGLHLIIAKTKEKHQRQPIEKVITIKRYSSTLLCPIIIITYVNYKTRFCQVDCHHSYPVQNGPCTFVCHLIHAVHNNSLPVGSERISNHIKDFIDSIPRPPGSTKPKARALESTAAVEAGASTNDVLTYGSWMSSAIFDTFYRLSRATAMDFTHLTLPSTSVL
ncbi:hypothetical protein INT45_000895 [Circinella minor]|uniref:Uncharacterized protein n=1 Tax=Circinella minor TaxID=1195481 RepID=A0A8H7RIA5_9FUNG|nr:hypothetical protein INT45_000895 [Circinella minor]